MKFAFSVISKFCLHKTYSIRILLNPFSYFLFENSQQSYLSNSVLIEIKTTIIVLNIGKIIFLWNQLFRFQNVYEQQLRSAERNFKTNMAFFFKFDSFGPKPSQTVWKLILIKTCGLRSCVIYPVTSPVRVLWLSVFCCSSTSITDLCRFRFNCFLLNGQSTGPSYKECFVSGNYEAWHFRGGLVTEFLVSWFLCFS